MGTFENKVSGDGEPAIYAVSEKYTGIWGESAGGSGVYGHSAAWHGVFGESDSNTGVLGQSKTLYGVHGVSQSSTGSLGQSDSGFGVHGTSKSSTGTLGQSESGFGVHGTSTSNTAIVGQSASGIGIEGGSERGDGVVGRGRRGVVGTSETYQGVFGWSRDNSGVVAESESSHAVFAITRSATSAGVFAANSAGGNAALFEGNVTVTGDLYLAGADVAEEFAVVEDLLPGTVVVLDRDGRLTTSARPYDTRVAGIISGAGDRVPALVLDRSTAAGARRPLAVTGKAWCAADARECPIEVGDLLTTAVEPGSAMRVTDRSQAIGAIIGKALTPLREGRDWSWFWSVSAECAMGRIYMRVYVHNETNSTLVLRRSSLAHGDWTPGGWTPPDKILAGQTGQFQSEGDLAIEATTGTEGTVEYTVADGRDDFIHVHFNSPLIESQYGNTFHVYAPPGYEITDRGGQGERGELHVRLRPTADRMVPRFHPRGRALQFTNRWTAGLPVVTVGRLYNDLWESLPGHFRSLDIAKLPDNWLPLTEASSGLCGGMVYTVMDYYHAHLQPAGVNAPDMGSAPTFSDDPLFQHIRERLLASFDILGGGWRFLAYSSPLYPNGDEGVGQFVGMFLGRSWISYREQWPRIQDDLDAGRLSPLGLIQTDNLAVGDNHQVLAYGYRKSGQLVRLYVYDPNEGRRVVTFDFDVTSTSGEVHVERRVDDQPSGGSRIWAFFRVDGYQPRVPPGGHRFDSLRPAILAVAPQPGTASARTAIATGPAKSLRPWLASI